MNKKKLESKFDRVRNSILESSVWNKESIVDNLNKLEHDVLHENIKQHYLIKDFISLFRREKKFLRRFVKAL